MLIGSKQNLYGDTDHKFVEQTAAAPCRIQSAAFEFLGIGRQICNTKFVLCPVELSIPDLADVWYNGHWYSAVLADSAHCCG